MNIRSLRVVITNNHESYVACTQAIENGVQHLYIESNNPERAFHWANAAILDAKLRSLVTDGHVEIPVPLLHLSPAPERTIRMVVPKTRIADYELSPVTIPYEAY